MEDRAQPGIGDSVGFDEHDVSIVEPRLGVRVAHIGDLERHRGVIEFGRISDQHPGQRRPWPGVCGGRRCR